MKWIIPTLAVVALVAGFAGYAALFWLTLTSYPSEPVGTTLRAICQDGPFAVAGVLDVVDILSFAVHCVPSILW